MNHSLIFNCHTNWHSRPGGSYRIAHLLREHGWDSEVLEWAPYWSQEELREFARQRITKKTVFLGFSCFANYWDDNLENFAAWAKQEYPHVKIILGMMGRPRIESKACDYVVFGFGENALLAIVASLTGNTPGTGIKFDPAYLAIGRKVVNANDFYPSFPMKSLMIKYEDRDYILPSDWLAVEFSRGCMFECLYCNFPVLGVKGDYTRDADDYVEQLQDAYDRFGVTNYYVADETFNDRTDKIIKFADATEKLTFNPFLSGFIRADLMVSREQDWEHLSRMGMLGHFYGVETFNHPTAKVIGKGMHPDKLKDGILKAKDHFLTQDRKLYRGTIALMVGLPKETKETLEQSANWIRQNWSDQFADFTPLEIPIDEYAEKPSKLSRDWAKWGYEPSTEKLKKLKSECVMVMHSVKNLNWKNEHMDLDWARKFSSKFFQVPEVKHMMTAHNFQLHWGSALGAETIEDALKLRFFELFDRLDASFIDRVAIYKSKKLSCDVESIIPLDKTTLLFNQTYGYEKFYDFAD